MRMINDQHHDQHSTNITIVLSYCTAPNLVREIYYSTLLHDTGMEI